MKENEIYKYGYEDGLQGVEARYKLIGKTLCVKIYGSNHWTDYLKCFFAWPRIRPWKNSRTAYHPAWWFMAHELWDHFLCEIQGHEIDKFDIIGHSMGGAVAAILASYLPEYKRIVTINAPRCGNRWAMSNLKTSCSIYFKALYDRGDVVRRLPFFYAKYPNQMGYGNTRPFWKAHNNMPVEWMVFPI